MDQDLLAKILQGRQSGVLAGNDQTQDDNYLNQLLSQTPPSDEEAQAALKTKRAMAPNPGDMIGDTSKQQLFPPDVYDKALEDAKGASANREAELKERNLNNILLQRRAMQAQGAPEDTLPKLPDNDEEIKRLKDTLAKAKGDSDEDHGMAMSLKARSGDDEPLETLSDKASTPEKSDEEELDTEEADDSEDDNTPTQAQIDPRMLDLINAQKNSGQLAAMQMIGKGAERFSAGLARREADKNYLNEMTPMINQPVENVMNQQKLAMQALEQDTKARDLQLKKDMDNPDSDVSDMARQILKRGAPDLKTEDLTATQMTQLIPGLKTVLESEYTRETKKALMADKRQDNLDKQAKRDADKQNQAYSEMSVKALGTRAPANVQLALKNSLFIQNAKGLLNQYPDLNKMPQEQVNTLNSELARIAGGGVATGHGMKALSSDTYNSNFKHFLAKAGNSPTGADLGKFIKNNSNYLDELDKVQKGVVNEFHKGMYNAYKDKLRPDQQERFMSEHPDAFAENPGAPQGTVTIKRKSDGATKTLSAQDATAFLKDPGYELVNK